MAKFAVPAVLEGAKLQLVVYSKVAKDEKKNERKMKERRRQEGKKKKKKRRRRRRQEEGKRKKKMIILFFSLSPQGKKGGPGGLGAGRDKFLGKV
jgi:hypothetical protein